MRYESTRDVELRLKNSVVMCHGRPVIVVDVEDVNTVCVTDIVNREDGRFRISDLDLAPSSAPLGYLHHGGKLLMSMRKPVRRYKQGLTTENMLVFDGVRRPSDEALTGRMPNILRAHDRSVGLCMLGKYGDVGDAFQAVRNGAEEAKAFSRNWAVAMINDELALLHRGSLAGFVTDTSVRLLPECFFLKEDLQKALGE